MALSAQPEGMSGSILPVYLATVDASGHVEVKGRFTAPGYVNAVQPIACGKGFVILSENFAGNGLVLGVYKLLKKNCMPYIRPAVTTHIPGDSLGVEYNPIDVSGKYITVATTSVVQIYRVIS
jgi:hypothetical protein